MPGTLVFVVGASGVGKDTLIKGARQALAHDPNFIFARRTITRSEDIGDEGHESVTPREFERVLARNGFFVHWAAHGLLYGIRREYREDWMAGRHVVVNGSRAAMAELLQIIPDALILQVSARPETIANRLSERARESEAEIRTRLERGAFVMPTVTLPMHGDAPSERVFTPE